MLWLRCAFAHCAQEDPASSSDEEPSSQQQQQQQRTPPLQQPKQPAAAAAAAAKLHARVRRLQQLEATGQISSPFLADVVASKLQQVGTQVMLTARLRACLFCWRAGFAACCVQHVSRCLENRVRLRW
jgi:hypothetical protein